jgi:hypothetical protein
MIASIHIASPGPRAALPLLLRPPDPAAVPGLLYAETTIRVPLAGGGRPPHPGRVAMLAAWEDDGALDEFTEGHPAAAPLADGWQARLEPLRVFGAWPAMPGLPSAPKPHDEEAPVAVLTLGRLRLTGVRRFLRRAAPAESEAVADRGILASAGLARPPRLVSTFSLWRSAAEMRDYAVRPDGAHSAAVRADRERPFHHESAFIRFRPYASRGSWDGSGDPLAALA